MTKLRIIRILLVLVLLPPVVEFCGADEKASAPPERYELKLIGISEGKSRDYIFAIGDSGFRTVEALKQFLASRPKGTEVKWAPGCMRLGNEPLLSSETEMQQFRHFLEKHGIKFILVPSG